MYEELVKRLRSHNGWALNKTLDEAADAIEKLQEDSVPINDMEMILSEVAKPRWIPVTEALPKKPQDYRNCKLREYYFLVTLETNAVVCREYDFDNKRWPGTIRVTHWMPLPEPPKEEEI